MNGFISNCIPNPRTVSLKGIARPMIYYKHRKCSPNYNTGLGKRISSIVEEGPQYGRGRVTAMIRRSGIIAGRDRVRRHTRHMNLIVMYKMTRRKHVPRTIVVIRSNVMWETDFQRYAMTARGGYISPHTLICAL